MRTFQLGSISGIPVKANWGALAIAGLFGLVVANGVLPQFAPDAADSAYAAGGVIAGLALLGSILVHEASHALVARRYDVEVSSITLWLFGGVAHLEGEVPSPRAEARIAGAGPLSSLLLGALAAGAAWVFNGMSPVLGATLLWIGGLNLVLAIFNLLPGAPLDGGRLLHAWLWSRSGSRARATVGAARAGRALGLTIAGFGVFEVLNGRIGGLWTAMIGLFLYGAAGQETRHGELTEALQGRTVEDIMSPLPKSVGDWARVAELLRFHHGSERRLLAVDFGGTPTAVVSVDQLARAVARLPGDRASELALRDLGLPRPGTLEADRPASDLLRQGGRSVVVNRDGTPIGIVGPRDLEIAAVLHKMQVAPAADTTTNRHA